MTALAVASMAIATPAFATATLNDQNGPDLNTKIYASHDDASVAPTVGTSTNNWTVYGNTSTSAGHDTSFQGFSSYNTMTQTGTGTSISITDGGGFAQVFDTNYVSPTGQNPNPPENDVAAIIMDPTPAFTAYEFSIQLALQGNDTSNLYVYYMLTGGSSWIQSLPLSGLVTGGSDNQFILNGLDPGQSFDKILIMADAPIFQVKQNSIDVVGFTPPVPEPGTWALMLLGFAGVGMTMRFRRRKDAHLAQIA